jgi:nucleotide-binding universal stress UspA family protein
VIERVLLAVDDTPDSLAATRLAVALAAALHARITAVHVSVDHLLDAAVQAASARPEVGARRDLSAAATLGRTSSIAESAGVPLETVVVNGQVGSAIIDFARDWPADLIIIGKSVRSGSGEPYVGSQTRHVLEFADQPVLVVPAPHRSAAARFPHRIL